uniref:Uncharacterized protein n=1 Tax=Timema bartmani TaxID=61472 RepID=A0A7R9F6S5_9NEOP|nr:unnamed protein product [Timema bartmani]
MNCRYQNEPHSLGLKVTITTTTPIPNNNNNNNNNNSNSSTGPRTQKISRGEREIRLPQYQTSSFTPENKRLVHPFHRRAALSFQGQPFNQICTSME